MAKYTKVLPTCHEPAECFAKSGSFCTALRETYPRGVRCPYRKTYESNVVVNGKELTPEDVAERKAKREAKKNEKKEVKPDEPRDFWEAFRYCSEH